MRSVHDVSFESLELTPGALCVQGYVCLVSGNHLLTAPELAVQHGSAPSAVAI